MNRTVWFAVGAAVVATIAGCGGSSPLPVAGTGAGVTLSSGSPVSVSGPDACTLLSDQQVASGAKHDVTSHASRPAVVGDSECVWNVTRDDKDGYREVDAPKVTLTVYLSRHSDADFTFKDLSRGGRQVTGLGDSAAEVNYAGEGMKLVVRKGTTVIAIYTNIHQTIGYDEPINEALGRFATQAL